MYDLIQEILESKARENDKALFLKWSLREITTEECLKEFKNNNDASAIPIDEDYFTRWLGSIGWRQKCTR